MIFIKYAKGLKKDSKVDLNRNFPLGFGLGADDNPCSEVYKGQVPPIIVNDMVVHDVLIAAYLVLVDFVVFAIVVVFVVVYKGINFLTPQEPLSEPETQALQLIAGLFIIYHHQTK